MRGPERRDRFRGQAERALQCRRYRPSHLRVVVSEQPERAGAIPVREHARGARVRGGGRASCVVVAVGCGRSSRAAAIRGGSQRSEESHARARDEQRVLAARALDVVARATPAAVAAARSLSESVAQPRERRGGGAEVPHRHRFGVRQKLQQHPESRARALVHHGGAPRLVDRCERTGVAALPLLLPRFPIVRGAPPRR